MTEDAANKRRRTRQVKAWWHEMFADIPAAFTPLDAVCAVKCLDEEGNMNLVTVKTLGLNYWEAFGMLSYAQDDFSSATINAKTGDDE